MTQSERGGAEPQKPPGPMEPPAGAPAARRVLVIDDNTDAARSLRSLLEMTGHDVEIAFDGREGVERARRFVPEVVLCDIGLPGMDGYQVARALRRDPALADACLVALSGRGESEDRRRAFEAGFDHHLTKPVAFEEILKILDDRGRRAASRPTHGSAR